MRYSLEHKARNREKILAMAARSIRERGGDTSVHRNRHEEGRPDKRVLLPAFLQGDDLFVLKR